MTNEEALKILTEHNKWRRGGANGQHNPKEIGEAIDVAIRCLFTPTESARAEEVLETFELLCGQDASETGAGRLFISFDNALQAMTTYAAPYIVEVERLKKEIEEANKTIGRLQDRRKDLMDHCDSIKSELTAANQRIAELENQIKYLNIR